MDLLNRLRILRYHLQELRLRVATLGPIKGLPDGLRVVKLRDGKRNLSYILALSDSPSKYEVNIASLRRAPLGSLDEVAGLICDLLLGRGTLIDVGAGIGTVAVPAAAAGNTVICIEMNPTNCLKLMTAAGLNEFDRFDIIQAAASDRDGVTSFTGDEVWGQVNEASLALPAIKLRLDTIWQMMKRESRELANGPVIIKIDVEGYEPAVLKGATELLSKLRPLIVFESIAFEDADSSAHETKVILENADYNLFFIHGNVLCPRSSSNMQEKLVSDFLAVPSNKYSLLKSLDYQVRELSDAERIAIVSKEAKSPVEANRKNAALVKSKLALL